MTMWTQQWTQQSCLNFWQRQLCSLLCHNPVPLHRRNPLLHHLFSKSLTNRPSKSLRHPLSQTLTLRLNLMLHQHHCQSQWLPHKQLSQPLSLDRSKGTTM